VRFRWRLALDVVNPHLIDHVAAAHNHNPVTPRPRMHVCTLPSSQYTPEAPRSHPPKGVGFPDPLSGTPPYQTLSELCDTMAARYTPAPETSDRTNDSQRSLRRPFFASFCWCLLFGKGTSERSSKEWLRSLLPSEQECFGKRRQRTS